MTYFYAQELSPESREVFLEWLHGEGLNPAAIYDNRRFSVHNGKVSGEVFLISTLTNELLYRNNEPVTVPFSVPQVNPLPEEFTA